jgi:intermembrane space import and assembly protein 40
MQECFREHPDVYGEELGDEEEVESPEQAEGARAPEKAESPKQAEGARAPEKVESPEQAEEARAPEKAEPLRPESPDHAAGEQQSAKDQKEV